MAKASREWRLVGFVEAFDSWAAKESPTTDLRFHVGEWIFSRADDPYQGARRAEGFPNLWFIPIPGAYDGTGTVVTCSFWIEEASGIVRCDTFASLNPPFL